MDKLRAMRYFLRVAETSSFTAAAKEFSVPGSSISRRIRDLEASLGVELFHRSTRIVRLTELGRLYYDQVQAAILRLDHADILVGQQSRDPFGILRITSIPGFGDTRLLPALEKLRVLYPKIVVDVEITDQIVDITSGEVDIAIRSTSKLPERTIARKLSDNRYLLVASNAYLERHGIPTRLDDLKSHRTLQYRGPKGVLNWQVRQDNAWRELETSPVLISNHGELIKNALLSGEGLTLLPEWSLDGETLSGQLQILHLEDAELSVTRAKNSGIFMLYFRPKYELQKVRVAVDFLLAELLPEAENV